ncbi:polysaccharide deacetylase family protein [Microbacterium limosum]|uniref:Polysaccharide deacetylase family protein n=1 Tax=Microbacterium limosum TaxID=3079935 RepID=A0AAU0ML07_9MICO|nr:polysaccharide deacetylase family protein [Microbacterium sp. Y20]WOQ70678.1 polysaccharide deacetylase family protein [Microbacterium sp. Y20]
MIGARRRALAAFAAAALVLTACAPEPDPQWQPQAWPESGRLVEALPAGSTSPPAAGEAAAIGQRIRNDATGIDARWAALPGGHAVNEAIEEIVRRAIEAQSSLSGQAYRPQAQDPGAGFASRGCEAGASTRAAGAVLGAGDAPRTVVVCEIVHAAGTLWGQSVRIVTGVGGVVTSDTTTTLYADVASGDVVDGSEILGDAAGLWIDVVGMLRRQAGSLSTAPVTAPDEAQRALLRRAVADAVVADRELVLPLPSGFSARELEGLARWRVPDADHPVSVALPAEIYTPLLTPFGRRLLADAGPFVGAGSRGAGFERVPCDLVPCMAMTLDDGPGGLTGGILDALRERGMAATFYMLGQNAARHPDLVRRVAAEGHQVGNHTWNHPRLPMLDDAGIGEQLADTAALLRQLSGQPVSTFRPPYGDVDQRVLRVAGQPAIMWSIDTRDWEGAEDATLAQYTVSAPRPGSIVLMHDIQAVTARVLPGILDGLLDRGFTLVTVEQLFGGAVPGGMVRSAR